MSAIAFTVLCILLEFFRTTSASSSLVDLGYAKYEGVEKQASGTTEFLGIRYAAPPINSLRFSAPRAPLQVEGIQRADALPNRCPQGYVGTASSNPFSKRVTASEDCLFLNVYAPSRIVQPLPVIIWIHYGGYDTGSASGFNVTDTFDGSDLVRESGYSIVAVIIQYRLGLYGFLAGNEVKHKASLNNGLLDQQFAFQWVQQYISNFGGDPAQVTIWGESSGAGSVLQHVIANGGQTTPPLFKRAITSSLFLPSQYSYNDPIPEALYSEVVAQSNCSFAADAITCLRAVDETVLDAINLNIDLQMFYGTFAFVPVVDGAFIRSRPREILRRQRLNGEYLLSVTNSYEGYAFVDTTETNSISIPEFVSQLFPTLRIESIQLITETYSSIFVNDTLSQAIAIMGEAIIICPTYSLLHSFEDRAFKAEFAIPPGGHGTDLPYYFPNVNPNGVQVFNNTEFLDAFTGSFLAFAISSSPNHNREKTILPSWNLWLGGYEMLFNKTEKDEPVVQPFMTSPALLERCDLWSSLGAETAQ